MIPMTPKEAKEAIKLKQISIEGNALRVASFARGLAVADEALNTLIPEKPIGDLHSCPHYRCPSCHRSVVLYEDSPKFPCCQWCGKKMDWSDT